MVFRFTGTQTEVINVGSYNYLGFAQNDGPCAEDAANAIDDAGLSVCTNVHEQGTLEASVARFRLGECFAVPISFASH
jgi:serine palmitoyltransferase